MARLYPPLIAGTIPAFAKEEYDTSFTIKIPFNMNRAVSQREVYKMCLVLKSTQNSTFVFSAPVESSSIDFDEGEATFIVTSDDLSGDVTIAPGLYFKAQICYKNYAGENGYYSTVGIIKCVSQPQVYIDGLNSGSVNNFSSTYIGKYDISNSSDKSEKLYSYQFTIYDSDYNTYLDSGEIIHSGLGDDTNIDIQTDEYDVYQTPNGSDTYYIQFKTTSLNGLITSSPVYMLKNQSYATLSGVKISAVVDSDNAYIDVRLSSDSSANGVPAKSYRLSRASSIDGYQNWTILSSITTSETAKMTLSIYQDFLIEQGVYYIYAVEAYNEYNLFSDKLITEKIQADFEDCFLYDGKRQLKIRYNPQVSSFKTDLLETKIDTIGGKYPYIFRNGYTEYKEFPISGLISYLMDEENLFLTEEELEDSQILITNRSRIGTPGIYKRNYIETSENTYYQEADSFERKAETDQTADNIFSERYFKLKVLDWLNDGKAKVFKSPTEGNYLIRLLNISLAPQANTSRMLHTFSATAYEIGEYKYTTLKDYGFIDDTLTYSEIVGYNSISLSDFEVTERTWITLFSGNDAGDVTGFTAVDFPFGTFLKVTLKNDGDQTYILTKDFEINYSDDSIESISAYLLSSDNSKGILTYQINSKFLMSSPDYFDLQKNVESQTITGQNFIFKDYFYEDNAYREEKSQISLLDLIQSDSFFAKSSDGDENYYKFELADIYAVQLRLRPAYIAYKDSDGTYYQNVEFDENGNITSYSDEWDFDSLKVIEPLAKIVSKNDDEEWWYNNEKVYQTPFGEETSIYCYSSAKGIPWSNLTKEKMTWTALSKYVDSETGEKVDRPWSQLKNTTGVSSVKAKTEITNLQSAILNDNTYTMVLKDIDKDGNHIEIENYLTSDDGILITDLSNVYDFTFGKNISVEVYYRYKVPSFGFEETNEYVVKAIKNYKKQYIYEKENDTTNILTGYPEIQSEQDDNQLIWNARHKTYGLRYYFSQYIEALSYAFGIIQNTTSTKNAPKIEDWVYIEEES